MGCLDGEGLMGETAPIPLKGLDWRLRAGSIPASVAVYECVSGEQGYTTRRAANLVWKIENSLHQQGWPTDVIIGSEASISKSYSVSREVVREAVRIGELHGSFRMQRGRGGGVMACRPKLETVTLAITEYMFCSGVTRSQLYHICELFEPDILAHVARNWSGGMPEPPCRTLDSLSRHLEFRHKVLERISDPVLALVWNISTWLGVELAPSCAPDQREVDEALRVYENKIMEAFAAGDAVAARRIRKGYGSRVSFLDLPLTRLHDREAGGLGDAVPGYTVNRSSQIARFLMD